jgi:hypothetical protein
MAAKTRKKAPPRYPWLRYTKDKLLDQRICDLGLTLEHSPVRRHIDRLYEELARKDIIFRPHFWLSDEWCCPDGVPGIAIPFFLAHSRLMRLENDFMMEVEGGNRGWCMRLLRHETGHAILNAYKLDQSREWKKLFGRPSTPYPDTYLPKPYSKRFVINLPNWYAQSHPHEDWAETFAVWLKPHFDWKRRYQNWPALKKLEYVDGLMNEIRGKKPRLRNKHQDYPVEKIKITLREFYADKVARYGKDSPDFFDYDLRKLFSDKPEHRGYPKASRYIRSVRRDIVEIVEHWTGEYRYRIDAVLKDMTKRCDQLELRAAHSDKELKPELTACVTMVVMNKLHSGGYHIAL